MNAETRINELLEALAKEQAGRRAAEALVQRRDNELAALQEVAPPAPADVEETPTREPEGIDDRKVCQICGDDNANDDEIWQYDHLCPRCERDQEAPPTETAKEIDRDALAEAIGEHMALLADHVHGHVSGIIKELGFTEQDNPTHRAARVEIAHEFTTAITEAYRDATRGY